MADRPPYMNAYGLIPKIMQKIKDAPRPERFTQDFLSTKLGFPGGSAKAFIPFAKRIGLLSTDGKPTDIYTKFRNDAYSGQAIAQSIRFGYKSLYERNEYVHELKDDELLGLIVEVTGLEKSSSTVRAAQNSYLALKRLASFDESEEVMVSEETATKSVPTPERIPAQLGSPTGMNLAYTINLNLPETTNIAVFNAIFKSLKEHLLQC